MKFENRLSANITLAELCASQEASRMGRAVEPTEEEYENLVRLATTVLQPLRDYFGKPLVISSGLRPPWLNKIVGGSETSAHMYGCAADCKVLGVEDRLVCETVHKLKLPVDQCILEFPPNGWVHLGIERVGAKRRNQFLVALRLHGKTAYERWEIR